MKKARKPVSFLLALVMVVGLFAAAPMTALAAAPKEVTLKTGTSGTSLKTSTDEVGVFSVGPTAGGYYKIETAKASGSDTFPTITSVTPYLDEYDAEISGPTACDGVKNAGNTAAVYYLAANYTYKIATSAADGIVKLNKLSSTALKGTTTENGLFMTAPSAGCSYTTADKMVRAEGNDTKSTLTFYVLNSSASGTTKLDEDSSIGSSGVVTAGNNVTVQGGTTYVVLVSGKVELTALTDLTVGGSAVTMSGKDSKGVAGTKDYQFNIPSDGLYYLDHAWSEAKTTPASRATCTVTFSGSSGLLSGKAPVLEVNARKGGTRELYYLSKGNYTLSYVNENSTNDWKDTLQFASVPTVKSSGGSSTTPSLNIAVIPVSGKAKASAYTFTYIQFTPDANGWYTIKAPAYGKLEQVGANDCDTLGSGAAVVLPTTKTASKDVWTSNLHNTNEDAYKMSDIGYFLKGETYVFKYTPDAGLVEGKELSKTSAITGNFGIERLDVSKPKTGTTMDVSFSGQGGIAYVVYQPPATGDYLFDVVSTSSGKSTASQTVLAVYPAVVPASVTTIEDANVKAKSEKDGSANVYTLSAEETYILAVQTYDGDNWTKTGKIDVNSTAGTGSKISIIKADGDAEAKVTPIVRDSGNNVVNGSGDPLTFNLVPNATYTVSHVALTDWYSVSKTFKADGKPQKLVLLPKAKPADSVSGTIVIDAGEPDKDNKVNVKVTGSNIKSENIASEKPGYWIGLKLPTNGEDDSGSAIDPKVGWGTGTWEKDSGAGEDCATKAGKAQMFYINIRPDGKVITSAWIRAVYNEAVVVYQLDLSKVTTYKQADDDDSQFNNDVANVGKASDPVIVVDGVSGPLAATAKTLAPVVYKTTADTADAGLTDEMVRLSGGVIATAAAQQKKAKDILNNYVKNYTDSPSGTASTKMTYRDFKVFTETAAKEVLTGDDLKKALTEDLKGMVHVTCIPFPMFTYKTLEQAPLSKGGGLTKVVVDISLKNQILVSAAAIVGKSDGDKVPLIGTEKIQTQYAKPMEPKDANLWTHKDLNDIASGGKNETLKITKVNAIQTDLQTLTVEGNVKVKLPLGDTLNWMSGDGEVFVKHTHGSKDYYYLAKYDHTNKDVTFISTHGFSTFAIEKDIVPAAGIVRDGLVTYYKTVDAAVADAKDSETIYVLPAGNKTGAQSWGTVSATNLTFVAVAEDKLVIKDGAVDFTTTGNKNTHTDIKADSVKVGTVNAAIVSNSADSATFKQVVWAGNASAAATTSDVTVKSASWSGTTTIDNNKAKAGETVKITLKPKDGDTLSGVTAAAYDKDGKEVTSVKVTLSGSGNERTFKMPTGLGTTYAYVQVVPTTVKGVTVKSATGGEVTYTISGSTVTLTVKAKDGYKLKSLTAENNSTKANITLTQSSTNSNVYTFTLPSGGATVTPVFETVPLTIKTSADGKVTATPAEPAAGSNVILTVEPGSGKELKELTVRTTSGNPVITRKLTGSSYSFQMPASGGVVVSHSYRSKNAAVPYTDTIPNWASDYVKSCYTKNLMTGTTATTFGGTTNVDRGTVWTILARYDGFYPQNGSPWYAEARTWAMQKLVGSTYLSDGTNGGVSITREDLATMLWRYKGSPASTTSIATFKDASQVDSWAVDAVKWAVEKGIIGGKDGNRLDPRGYATRNEVAKMIAVFDTI